MARTLSSFLKTRLNDAEMAEVLVVLFTLEHDDFDAPLRFSTDNRDELVQLDVRGTLSRGEEYPFLPLRIILPDDTEEGESQASVEIDNVVPDVLAELRAIDRATAVTCTLEVVTARTPDVVELGPILLTLRGIEYDAATIRATFGAEDLLNESFPGGAITPTWFPGVFG
jgi:hypothetical protein